MRPVKPIEPPARLVAAAPSRRASSYAHSGSVNIAYQVIGSGPIDLVFVMGWVSHLEYFWNEPHFARFLERLASMARLILFDKRGTGLSDPVPVSQLPTLEQRLDDVRAVMEAAGSTRAVLMGVSEGGPLCSLFAATYPERTEALVTIGSYARRMWAPEYPWGHDARASATLLPTIIDQWGGPVGLEERAPSMAADPAFREWWASYLRMGASPGAAVALTRMNAEIDIRDVLPSIRVPTLVLHRSGDRCLRVEEGRYLASRIPAAHASSSCPARIICRLPAGRTRSSRRSSGSSQPPARLVGRTGAGDGAHGVVGGRRPSASIAAGCSSARSRRSADTPSARHRRLAAAFDGPGRAVQCGSARRGPRARSRAARRRAHRRMRPRRARGPLTEISARIAKAAAPGEVLVSRTVVDLVPGSGLQFDERGGVRAAGLSASCHSGGRC